MVYDAGSDCCGFGHNSGSRNLGSGGASGNSIADEIGTETGAATKDVSIFVGMTVDNLGGREA